MSFEKWVKKNKNEIALDATLMLAEHLHKAFDAGYEEATEAVNHVIEDLRQQIADLEKQLSSAAELAEQSRCEAEGK
jgi:flagellar biosynthesis/type III secretory pathway protein FliH